MELNGFYNHVMHILRPKNTESGEPELKNIGYKSKDKNDIILHNSTINARWNQITYMVQVFVPLFQ